MGRWLKGRKGNNMLGDKWIQCAAGSKAGLKERGELQRGP